MEYYQNSGRSLNLYVVLSELIHSEGQGNTLFAVCPKEDPRQMFSQSLYCMYSASIAEGSVCLRCLSRALTSRLDRTRRSLHKSSCLLHDVQDAHGSRDHAAVEQRQRQKGRHKITLENSGDNKKEEKRQALNAHRAALEKLQNPDRLTEEASASQQDGDTVRAAKSPDHRSIRPKAWRAFLRSDSLGEPASVLVLRDAEGQPDRLKGQEHVVSQSVENISTEELVASMNASKNAPGQQEVNDAIDQLRPLRSRREAKGPIMIPQKEFESLLQSLDEKFNQLQLSRYVTFAQASRMMQEQKSATKEKQRKQQGFPSSFEGLTEMVKTKSENEKHARILQPWTPISSIGVPLSKIEQRPVYKGKKGVIDTLLRRVWNIEVVEEIYRAGVLALEVEQERLALLLEDRAPDSILAQASRQLNVTIDADRSLSALMIVSDKPTCVTAANMIMEQLSDFRAIKLRLELLMPPPNRRFDGILDLKDAFRIAAEHHCKLTEDQRDLVLRRNMKGEIKRKKHDRIWTLRSFSWENATACIRAIVKSADGRFGQSKFFLNVETPEEGAESPLMRLMEQFGTDPFKTDSQGPSDSTHIPSRFTIPARVARGDTPTMMRVDYNLLHEKNLEKSLESLEKGFRPRTVLDADGHGGRSTYTASFGQFQWLSGGPRQDVVTWNGHIEELDKERRFRFEHSRLGLPQLLNRLPDLTNRPPISKTTELRVRAILHPLSLQAVSNTSHYPPIVDLRFQPHPQQRLLKYKETHILLPAPTFTHANILCPALATDIQLSQYRSIRFELPASRTQKRMGREFSSFVHSVEKSGAGYGNVTAPADAVLYVPFWGKGAHRAKAAAHPTHYAGMKMMERKMFTSAVEFVQEVRWALPELTGMDVSENGMGPQLVYTQSSGGKVSREKLEVQFVNPFTNEKLGREKRGSFLAAINGVLLGLNKGLGRMDLKAVEGLSEMERDDGLEGVFKQAAFNA